jgi:hypothetical protein
MSRDDLPAQQEWMGAELRADFDQTAEWPGYAELRDVGQAAEWRGYAELRDLGRTAEWRGYFDDVVDVICTDAQRQDQRYGYGAGLSAGQEARDGRHVARHGKSRRNSGNSPLPAGGAGGAGLAERMWSSTRNRAGAAALTAAAVVGTGVSAGMLGFVPFTPPAATPSGAAAPTSAAVPALSSVRGNGAPVQHHAEYVGKHRKPLAAPSSALTHLSVHPQTSPAGVAPSVAATPASTGSPSSAGVPASSHQVRTSSPASRTTTQPSPHSPSSSSPAPQSGTTTPTSGGSGTGTPTPTPTSTGTTAPTNGGGGLVGGLLGGVGGLVGGLL